MSTRTLTLNTAALLAFSALAASAAVQPAGIESADLVYTDYGTAQYSGDTTYAATKPTTSHAVTGIATTTVLTISTGLLISYGITVDGVAQVQAADNSHLTGTITFYDGATTICTTSVSGTPGCPSTAGAGFVSGRHSLTAVYSGDTTHSGSTSNIAIVIVVPDITTATLTSSLNPVPTGQSVILTATLAGDIATPVGPVTFLDNGATLGTATLDASGHAILTTSVLTAGIHNLTAVYAATQNFEAATSPAISQVITAASQPVQASFIIGASSTSLPTGASANILVKVSPINGFNQPVQLNCANLPSEASCTFATTVIPAGGGTTTLKLTTLAPRACGSATAYGQTASLTHAASTLATSALAGPSLAGLLIFLIPKNRRALKTLLTLIAMCGAIAITGCGACTDLGTRPGTYTIQITGTSASSAQVTVTQNVQITVTE